MPRNLDRRVEIAFPVLDPDLQARIREILEIQLADTVKARRILADGSSERIPTRAGERCARSSALRDHGRGRTGRVVGLAGVRHQGAIARRGTAEYGGS